MKASAYLTILALLFLSSTLLNGQIRTSGVALGLGGGALAGDTDFGRDEQYGYHGNAFIRHSIIGPIEGQVTGSVLGQLLRTSDNNYSTDIYSADYRLLLRPFAIEALSPYFYGGFGALYFEVTQFPANRTANTPTDAWVGVIPAGGGLQIKLAQQVSLDLSIGYNFALSDDLNGFVAAGDDGYYNAVAGITFTRQSGNADPDQDGLSNKEEDQLGTNKKLADTDGDGVNDGDEFRRYRSNPLSVDTDNDGLDDRDEVIVYKSDPRKIDTDNDGLTDREETVKYQTNPLRKDSDGDRVKDTDEINISNTDPRKKDTDDDGLDDGVELTQYRTNPLNADTDGDGLTDREEVVAHSTNPLQADSDGDGLSDKEEVSDYLTDPMAQDSDQGSVADGVEVTRGTNPLNADDDVVLVVEDVGSKIVLEGIIFATGRADISDQSKLILEKAYNTLIAFPDIEVEIRGFTDSTGGYGSNVRLSQRRADAVRVYLLQLGIDPARITARGFGPESPIAPNSTVEGRARNRRIEFVRTK